MPSFLPISIPKLSHWLLAEALGIPLGAFTHLLLQKTHLGRILQKTRLLYCNRVRVESSVPKLCPLSRKCVDNIQRSKRVKTSLWSNITFLFSTLT